MRLSSVPRWMQYATWGIVFGSMLLVSACGGNVTITETTTDAGTGTTPTTGGTTAVPTLAPPAMVTPLPVTATPIPPPPPLPTPTPPPTPVPYTHLVVNQQQLTGSNVGPVSVSCPAGEVALGGGWATSGFGTIYNSTHTSNGWEVYVNHSGNDLINAYVECLANLSSAVVTSRLTQITIPASTSSQSALATCQSGEIVVGGGFALSSTTYLNGMQALGAQGWAANFGNYGSSGALANVYAICLQGSYSNIQIDGSPTIVSAGSTGGSSATCPSGFYTTGGSYTISAPANVYNSSPTNTGWEGYISVFTVLGTSIPSKVTAHAECVAFG